MNAFTVLKTAFWLSLVIPARALLTVKQPSQLSCTTITNSHAGIDPDLICEPITPFFPTCDGFDTVDYTQGASDYDLVLLGEYHTKKNATVRCLDQLTKGKKHIVYLEGIPAGKEVSCEKHRIPEKPGRKCIGWDDMEAVNQLTSQKTLVTEGKLKPNMQELKEIKDSKGYSDETFDKILNFYQNEFKNKDLSELSTDDKIMLYTINKLLEEKKKGSTYDKIFSAYTDTSLVKITPEITTNTKLYNLKRNNSLINTLANNPHGIFAVAIAGKTHLVHEKDAIGDDYGAAEYVRTELRRGTNRYAILAMTR